MPSRFSYQWLDWGEFGNLEFGNIVPFRLNLEFGNSACSFCKCVSFAFMVFLKAKLTECFEVWHIIVNNFVSFSQNNQKILILIYVTWDPVFKFLSEGVFSGIPVLGRNLLLGQGFLIQEQWRQEMGFRHVSTSGLAGMAHLRKLFTTGYLQEPGLEEVWKWRTSLLSTPWWSKGPLLSQTVLGVNR